MAISLNKAGEQTVCAINYKHWIGLMKDKYCMRKQIFSIEDLKVLEIGDKNLQADKRLQRKLNLSLFLLCKLKMLSKNEHGIKTFSAINIEWFLCSRTSIKVEAKELAVFWECLKKSGVNNPPKFPRSSLRTPCVGTWPSTYHNGVMFCWVLVLSHWMNWFYRG